MYKPEDTSVIVPCFNEAESASRCVRSLAAQSVQPGEIVFVDNGSTDGTAEILSAEIKALIKNTPAKIVYEARKGIPFARNCGIANSSGKIIIFLDGDCVAPPNYVELILENFNRTNIQAVAGTYVLDGENNKIAALRQKVWSLHFGWEKENGLITEMRGQDGAIISGCSAFLRDTLAKLGYFDERFIYMDDIALSEKFYRLGFTAMRDKRIKVKHFIDTTEKAIARKDFRYGSDRALINALVDSNRIKIDLKHYLKIASCLISILLSNEKGFAWYELRSLIYYKSGLFISGLKMGCLFV